MLQEIPIFLENNSFSYNKYTGDPKIIILTEQNHSTNCLILLEPFSIENSKIYKITNQFPTMAIVDPTIERRKELELLALGIHQIFKTNNLTKETLIYNIEQCRLRFETLNSKKLILSTLYEAFPFQMAYRIEVKPGKKQKFIYVGEGIRHISGLTPEDVLNDPYILYNQIIPEDQAKLSAAESQAGLTFYPLEVEVRKKNARGELKWVHIRSHPSKQADGTIVWDGIETDISKYKKIEERIKILLARNKELLESERHARSESEKNNRMKDQFLATLSHELRNPISSVLSWVRLIRSGKLNPEEAQQAVTIVERNANIQLQLINDLLDMNRIISGKVFLQKEKVELNQLVLAAIENIRPMGDAKKIFIYFLTNPTQDLYILGDPSKLQQIVSNLLSNAIKFTPEKGAIHVKLSFNSTQAQLSIQDTGIGIEPQFLPNVFERFSQADSSLSRKFGGLGLGLTIVKHLTTLHNGSVTVHSEGLGKGAIFSICLPLLTEQMDLFKTTSENLHAALEPTSIENTKILLIDDDRDALELIARILTQSGAIVSTAESGQKALELLRQHNCDYDLIISDIGMPNQDGIELIKKMRAFFQTIKNIPAIALTAFSRPEDRQKILAAGYLKHLTKPIDTIELLCIINTLTNKSYLEQTSGA